MKKHVLVALAAAAVLAGCSSDEPGNNFRGEIIEVPSGKDVALSRAETEVAANINSFANDLFHVSVDLYKDTFEGEDGNMSVSPFSASLALAMAANAGDESVAADIAALLHCDDLDLLNSTCNKLMLKLSNGSQGVLTLANSLWYNSALTPKSELIDRLNQTYYAEVEKFDAANEKESLDMINGWISAKTNGHINDLIESVDPLKYAFFINTLYFNANWSDEFDESKTTDAVFNGTNGSQRIKMMHNEVMNLYGELEKADYLRLSYEGNRSLYLIRPKEGVAIDELSRTFDFTSILADPGRSVYADLSLPKFNVRCSSIFDYVFNALGFNTIGRYFPKLGLKEQCAIMTLQKTMVNVSEKGTEMAAATDVEISYWANDGSKNPYLDNITFTVDRPFLYAVTDNATGAILMAGRVCNL